MIIIIILLLLSLDTNSIILVQSAADLRNFYALRSIRLLNLDHPINLCEGRDKAACCFIDLASANWPTSLARGPENRWPPGGGFGAAAPVSPNILLNVFALVTKCCAGTVAGGRRQRPVAGSAGWPGGGGRRGGGAAAASAGPSARSGSAGSPAAGGRRSVAAGAPGVPARPPAAPARRAARSRGSVRCGRFAGGSVSGCVTGSL